MLIKIFCRAPSHLATALALALALALTLATALDWLWVMPHPTGDCWDGMGWAVGLCEGTALCFNIQPRMSWHKTIKHKKRSKAVDASKVKAKAE